MDDPILEEIEQDLMNELAQLLTDKSREPGSVLENMQPPQSVINAAAIAAAQVLVAFERGIHIGEE